MSLRLFALFAVLTVVQTQCAFNSLEIFAGTNRFTGLDVATAFGGGIINIVESTAGTCVLNGMLPMGSTCTFSNMAGTSYMNTIIATCGAGGIYIFAPTQTLTPLDCAVPNAGTATITPNHKFGETSVYVCAADTTCSVANCEAQCNTGTVVPQVNCLPDCPLGSSAGMLVATTTVGSAGGDCSGNFIAVGTFTPTCSVTAINGYTCPGLPPSVSCTVSNTQLITTTCTENLCAILAAITTVGVVPDTTAGQQCQMTNVQLSAITQTSCDIKCDQAAGYQAQLGEYTCGDAVNKAAGQAIVSSITTCDLVPCPADSTVAGALTCLCNQGFAGTISYSGTAYTGSCTLQACPADSTATTLPTGCPCNSGFTGMQNWDPGLQRWTHTCVAHCANAFVASCNIDSSVVANPATTPCTGTGNCNTGGCPACLVTDCCVENICTAPGTSFPGYDFSASTGGATCTTAASCTPVTCLAGYQGTPVIRCPTSSVFSFNPGCVPETPCDYNSLLVPIGGIPFIGATINAGVTTVTPSAGTTCAAGSSVSSTGSCQYDLTGYISATATCNNGVWSVNPVAGLVGELCITPTTIRGAGTFAPATPRVRELITITCPANTYCNGGVIDVNDPCKTACSDTAPRDFTPQVGCVDVCDVGTITGASVETVSTGPGGVDCSGSTVPGEYYTPTCRFTQTPGYTCVNLPTAATCTDPGVGMTAVILSQSVVGTSCTENSCLAYTFGTGVIASTTAPACNNGEVLTSVTRPACNIMCDQLSGYQTGTATVTCGLTGGAPTTTLTCTPVPCPVNSHFISLTNCVCDTGYEGVISYSGVIFTGACTVISCAAFSYPTGIADGTTPTPCNNNIQLLNTATCTLSCDTGYITGAGTLSCNPATKVSTTSLVCNEKSCLPFLFGAGVTGGVVDGCVNGIALMQITDSSCSVDCSPGFHGTAAILSCPTTKNNGDAVDGTITCLPNTCLTYSLKTGERYGTTNGCTTAAVALGLTCSIECAVGYSGNLGSVTCPGNSIDGATPTVVVDPGCVATCASYSCSTGYSGPLLPNKICLVGGCDDASCCTIAPCPADSDAVTMPTVSCPCRTGFSGTPTWNAATRSWSHICTPNCGGFVCPAGYASKDFASNILCNPTGCTQPVCCDQDCMVPTVIGATVTGCTEAVPVTHGTVCTWVAEPGATCTNVGMITCNDGSFPVTPTCAVDSCNVGLFDFTAANVVVGQSLTPCDTVPQGSCTLTCDVGYTGPAVVSCTAVDTWTVTAACQPNRCMVPIVGTTDPQAADYSDCILKMTGDNCQPTCDPGFFADGQIVLSCAAGTGEFSAVGSVCRLITCTGAVFDPIPHNVQPITTTGVCDTAILTPCVLTCTNRYSGSPSLTCTAVNTWTVTNPCTDVCIPRTAASLVGTDLPTGTDVGTCVAGAFTATSPTCQVSNCIDGYVAASGPATITCSPTGVLSTALAGLTCTELDCQTYVPAANVNRGTCPNPIVLQPYTNPTCDLQCASGYQVRSGTSELRCRPNALIPTTTLLCEAIECNSLTALDPDLLNAEPLATVFPCNTVPKTGCPLTCKPGYTPAMGPAPELQCQGVGVWSFQGVCDPERCDIAFDFTANHLVTQGLLGCNTVPDLPCTIPCDAGWTGSADVSCTAVDTWVVTTPCVENKCGPFTFPDGITGGSVGTACTDGIELGSTVMATCAVTCMAGYRPDPATNAGTVTCSSTANNGDAAVVDLICQKTCGLHACVHPHAILRLFAPSSIDCLGSPSVCTDERCCVGVIVDPTIITTTENGRVPGEFTVRLVSEPTADVSIPVVNTNIAEGELSHPSITAPGTSTFSLVFTQSNWNILQTVTVTGLDDFIVDGDVTYKIELRGTTSMDADYNNIEPNDVTVTNIEITDTTTLSISLTPSQTVSATESTSRTNSLSETMTTSLSETISLSKSLSGTMSLTDTTLTLTESFSLSISESLTLTESIPLPTETMTATESFTFSLSDSYTPTVPLPTGTRTQSNTIDGTNTAIVPVVNPVTETVQILPSTTVTIPLSTPNPTEPLAIRESRVRVGSMVAVRNSANGVWLVGTVLGTSIKSPVGQVLVRTKETSGQGAYYDHVIPADFFPGDKVLVRNNIIDRWEEGVVVSQVSNFPVIRTSKVSATFDFIRPEKTVVGGVVLARDTRTGIWQVGIVTHSGSIQTDDGTVHAFNQVLEIGYRPGDPVHIKGVLQLTYVFGVIHSATALLELTVMREPGMQVMLSSTSLYSVQPIVFSVCGFSSAPNIIIRQTGSDPFQIVGLSSVSTINPPGEITIGNTNYNQIQEQGTAVGRLVRGIPPTATTMQLGLAVGQDMYLALDGSVESWTTVFPNSGSFMDSIISDGQPDTLVNISTGPNGELLQPETVSNGNGTVSKIEFNGYEKGHPVHVRDNTSSGWRTGIVENADTTTDPVVTRRWHQYFPIITESNDVLVRDGDAFQWSIAVIIQSSFMDNPPTSRTRDGISKAFLQTIPAGFRINSPIEVRDSLSSPWLSGVVANVAGRVPTVVLNNPTGGVFGLPGSVRSYTFYRPPISQLVPGSSVLSRNNDAQEWQLGTITSTSSNLTMIRLSAAAAITLTGQQQLTDSVIMAVNQIFPRGLSINDTVKMRDGPEPWSSGVATSTSGDQVLIAKKWMAIQPQVLCEGNLVVVRDSDIDPWREGIIRVVTADQTLVETEPSQWEKTEPAGYANGDAVLVRDSDASAWKQGIVTSISRRSTLAIATVEKSWPHIRPAILQIGTRVLVRQDSFDSWQEGAVVDSFGLIRTGDDIIRSWEQIEPLGYRKGDSVVVKDKTGNQERGVVEVISVTTGEATVTTRSGTKVWPHIHPTTVTAGSQVVVKDHIDEPWRFGYVSTTVDDFSVVPLVQTEPAWWNQILPRPVPVIPTTSVPETPTPPISPVTIPIDVPTPTVFIHTTLLKTGCTETQILNDQTCWNSNAFRSKIIELMPDIRNCGDIINIDVATGAAIDPDVLLGVNFDDCPPSSSADLLKRFNELLKRPANKGEFQSVGTKIIATYLLAPDFISNNTVTIVPVGETLGASKSDDEGVGKLWVLWVILSGLAICCCLMVIAGRSRRESDKKKWEDEANDKSFPVVDEGHEQGSPNDYDSDNDMCMKGDQIPYQQEHYDEDDFRIPTQPVYSEPSPVPTAESVSPLIPSQYYTPPAPDSFESPPADHYRSITKPLPTRSLGRGTLHGNAAPAGLESNGQRFPIKV